MLTDLAEPRRRHALPRRPRRQRAAGEHAGPTVRRSAVMADWHTQGPHGVRFDWGPAAAAAPYLDLLRSLAGCSVIQ